VSDKNKALSEAAFNDDVELINKLISEGANPDGEEMGRWGPTPPLIQAAYQGKYLAAQALISAGANVNRHFADCTPLYVASCHGHKDIVELLVESGADINATCSSGATSLIACAKRGYKDICNFLIEKGADFNILDRNHGSAFECLRLAEIAKQNNNGVWPPEQEGYK